MAIQSDAIVIGAGISGLTAQHILARQQKTVTLIAPDRLGGVLKTEKRDGFTLEQGPNVIIEKPEIVRLIDRLNLRGEVIYPNDEHYRQYVAVDGTPIEVPKGPGKFLFSNLFSPFEKARIIRALLFPGAFATSAQDESVLRFFARGIGENVVRRVLDPVLKGVYGGDIETLSAGAVFPGLYPELASGSSLVSALKKRRANGASRPKIFVFRQGMASFAQALFNSGGEFTERVEREVASARVDGSRFEVHDQSGGRYQSTQLVIAVPLKSAARILAPDCGGDQLLRLSEARRYAPLTIVHCSCDSIDRFPGNAFGVLFPTGTPHGLLGAMFNSLLFPHLAPEGKQLITLCFGGVSALAKREDLSPDKSVIEALCRDMLGADNVAVLASHSWHNAISQYELGHHAVVSTFERLERQFPGLSFVSADRGGIGVGDRVRSAMELLGDE